mgnify:CR=1 FL=1
MKRSDRMAPVQRVLGSAEREKARDLGAAQKSLAEAEARLQELQRYQDDYLRDFQQRASAGQSALALRDFQTFLARLQEAVGQQERVVSQAREAQESSSQQWQGAARRVKSVDLVVGRWQQSERRSEEQAEQKSTDERAQRATARNDSNGAMK